jgi:hypothetical protein
MPVDWSSLLTVDSTQIDTLFVTHPLLKEPKLVVRGYTLPFTGTQQNTLELFKFLRRQLLKYVFPENQRPPDIDWTIGRDKFGDIPPASDGKLGEFLLYAFVEAHLQTPQIAYKLKELGNPNDQVKGSDGVFIGSYDGQDALLIGESKIHATLSSALRDAMKSLQRFHDCDGPYATELLIATTHASSSDMSPSMLEQAYALLDRSKGILVHPLFIAADLDEIASISQSALNAQEAEKALQTHIQAELASCQTALKKLATKYPKPFQVYLDLFFLPVEDSLKLRNSFYELLHNTTYVAKEKATKKKVAKKNATKTSSR